MDLVKILIRAKEYVKIGWPKGSVAKLSNGKDVYYWDERATSWCAIGAIGRSVYDIENKLNSVDISNEIWIKL